ncbi:MAG: DUF3526 domain-containing protein [Bacteroidota bacterium]
MKFSTIFLYEWKHFIRSPFKLIAMLLFIIASMYGLHNGAALFEKQSAEIAKIEDKIVEERESWLAYYEKGEKGPEDRPWVDLSEPFWAVWNAPIYHFKSPSPALVYNIGQAEQYGFYKDVNFGDSTYDADMTEEIANPERLQSGTLDFSFVALYLLPLLLLIFLYNIKGAEADKGFLPLIYSQTGKEHIWLLARVSFYGVVLLLSMLVLMLYGAQLTGVFASASGSFFQIFYWLSLYVVFWLVIYTLILHYGNGSIGNTLKMLGVWLLFAFIVPATVHQWISIEEPASLMTEFIDAKRDETDKLWEEEEEVIEARISELYPEIKEAGEENKKSIPINESATALSNEMVKESIALIENRNENRNKLIRFTYWFNPMTFMQNKLNELSHTHYQDYKNYRDEIQGLIDKQIKVMVLDGWKGVEVDKQKYLEYEQILR